MPADPRPLIVGMNNPLSLDPRYALYPLPAGCAGHRLYEMLRGANPSVTMNDYVHHFERINLVTGPWDLDRARERADELRPSLVGRRVVVLGRGVARAFGLPPCHPTCELTIDGITFFVLPHPSGRNLVLNDPEMRVRVGRVLSWLYGEEQS